MIIRSLITVLAFPVSFAPLSERSCIATVTQYEDCMSGVHAGTCGIRMSDIRQAMQCAKRYPRAQEAWLASMK